MNGKVTRVIYAKFFGFIRDEEENDRFFHANDVRDVAFADLKVGDAVTFTPRSRCFGKNGSGNGLRADKVKKA